METLISSIPIWFGTVIGAAFGLLIGSFFNVVIYRMPRGESLIIPPSHCTQCGYQIKFYQNVPILSWLLLRGKCKSCGVPISMQYPIVEALTGLISALVFTWAFQTGSAHPLDFKIALIYLVLTSIPIFIIDFRHFLIPDALTLTGIVLGLGLSFIPGGMTPLESLIGASSVSLFLWLVGFVASRLLKKDAMGFGDVKLVAMSGALFGIQTATFGLVFASFLGCAVGLPMLLLHRLNNQRHIPFGPYICIGALIAAFFGEGILAWYLNML